MSCLFFALLSSCASWDLKNRCEAENWFEYSQNLAFEGKYLEEDKFIKECKGVDRTNSVQLDQGFKLGREKMCNYDEIKLRGSQGQPVFFKFCDGLDLGTMKKRFSDGLEVFCTSERGYHYGKSGKVYQKVCSADKEKQFLPQYYKGRKEYLTQFLAEKKEQASNQLSVVEGYAQAESNASRAYYSIPNLLDCKTIQVYNEYAKRDESKTVCSEPFYIRSQRDNIYSTMMSASRSLQSARAKYDDFLTKIQWAQSELNILPL